MSIWGDISGFLGRTLGSGNSSPAPAAKAYPTAVQPLQQAPASANAQLVQAQQQAQQVAAQRATQQAQLQQQINQQQAQKPSFVQGLEQGIVGGIKPLAQGIARELPGGTADIQAQQNEASQAVKNIQYVKALQAQGKISPQQANKLVQSNVQSGAPINQTLRAMPTQAQIAESAGNLAGDIVTGGTLPGGAAANIAGQAVTGGLGAAAQGGTPQQIAENAVIGAAIPAGLHVGGKVLTKVAPHLGEAPQALNEVGGVQKPIKTQAGNGEKQNLLTTMDKIIAQSTGDTPENVAAGRIKAQTNADAQRASLEHLQNGGTRDEAVAIYQKQTGVSQKMAKFKVQQAAKQAKQALRPNASGENPELANFNPPEIQPGDWQEVARRPAIVKNVLDFHEANINRSLGALSQNDRANYIDYVQGTKDVSKAENPAAVEAAVTAFRKGADTVHAFDTKLAGGNTRYIQKFFPDYWDAENPKNVAILQHKAEQEVEERVGPDTWRNMSNEEKAQELMSYQQKSTLDTGNYSGFHNKERVFANRQEGLAAKMKPLYDDPAQDIHRYFNGAKLSIGNQALIQGARKAELPGEAIRNSIDLPGDTSFQVSDKGNKALKRFARKEVPDTKAKAMIKKTARGLNSSVVKTIVANPLFHGANQEFNGLFQAAWRMDGNAVKNMLQLIRNHANITDEDRLNFYKEGNFSPDYGKTSYGFIAKGLDKAGIDPKLAELPPRAMAAIEENIRVGLWKIGKEQNMKPADITEVINKTLGGPEMVGDMASSVGLFLHYLTTNAKLAGDIGVQAVKGNIKPLVGLAVGYGAWMAATKAWQEATGNPNASVRAPGVLGTIQQFAKAPGQIARGQVPSVITSHTNPAIKTGIEQITNRNLSYPVVGPEARTNNLDGQRLSSAAGNLLGPAQAVQRVQGQRTSVPEAALGLAAGAYTPHAKGYQAAPNIPILNTPGAKPGNGLIATNAYYKMKDNMFNGVKSNSKTADVINGYFDRNYTKDGTKMSPGTVGGYASAKDLITSPDALARIYKGEHSLPGNDPLWKLPLNAPEGQASVTNYLKVQSQYEGNEKDGEKIRQQGAVGKGWITDLQNARSKYFSSLGPGSSAPANEPAYPTFNAQTSADMKTASDISDSKQFSQFLSTHQNVTDAFSQISQWTNGIRKLEGGPPLPATQQASPQLQKIINTYDALPASKSGGNTNPATNKMRANWIKVNQGAYNQMTEFYAQSSMTSLLKNAITAVYSGQNANSQPLLKNVKSAGQNVVQGPNGSYAIGASSGGSGSSGSSSSSGGGSYHLNLQMPQNSRVRVGKARNLGVRLATPSIKKGKIKTKPYRVGSKSGNLPIASF